MLVKEKTEWEDREQVFQRHLIASMTRKHLTRGWLQQDRGEMILSLLGAGGGVDRTVQRQRKVGCSNDDNS